MRRSSLRLLAVGAALAVAATACTSGDAGDTEVLGPARGATQGGGSSSAATVTWSPCQGEEDVLPPEAQCATLTVPLDHDDPDGDTIDLALARIPATGTSEGSVLLNPGGPGGSGIDFLAGVAAFGTGYGDLLERFDLVGFDPRGVDRSGGLRCLDDAEMERLIVQLDPTPDTPEEEAALTAADESSDAACQAAYGDTLRFYSTEATARDMDLIRAAVGDEQLTFYGISYGTYLGATYATLFPDRVRAMVLDSAYDPTGQDAVEQARIQLVGFETEFQAWADWCETDDGCAFRTADVPARWDALAAALDATPAPSADDPDRAATEAVLRTATGAALYDRAAWPQLGSGLLDAENGDGTGLLALADGYSGRNDDGTYNTLAVANAVISCASGFSTEPPADPAAAVAELKAAAPRMAADLTPEDLADTCPRLLGATVPAAAPLSYDGDAPILVIGGTGDPATPFVWAEKMTAALGASATLVTYEGNGHGMSNSNLCLMELTGRLLADRSAPMAGTTCAAEEVAPAPAWWDALPEVEGATPYDLPAVVWQQFGFDSTAQHVESITADASPADVIGLFSDALPEWESVPLEGWAGDVVARGFQGPDGAVLVIAIPAELLGEDAGLPAGGSLVLLVEG